MKDLIAGTIFWIIILGILFLMATVAEILSKVITIDMVIKCTYVMLFISILYLIKK